MNVPYTPSGNYGTSGKTDSETRSELAIRLLTIASSTILIALIGSLILIWFRRIEPDKAVTLILAISSIYSGLLGSAITYYFSSK